jgi:hypothetical protein
MRLGWLADARIHLACLGLGLGAILCLPEMPEAAEKVHQRADEAIERMALDARIALGFEPDSAS